jgi:hypothetical protein
LAFVVGVLIWAPTLECDLVDDDYALIGAVAGSPTGALAAPFELYRFQAADPRVSQDMVRTGQLPWWTHPEARFQFWRPLTSLILTVEYHCFGRRSAAYNVHSLVWYALLIWGSSRLFARLDRSRLTRGNAGPFAALALVAFSVSETHLLGVTFISARHILIAANLGVFALLSHIRWRDEGWKPGRPLSLLALVLALMAGEVGLQSVIFLACFELFGAKQPLRERLRVLTPVFALVAVYLVGYIALRRGVSGIYGYGKPFENPGLFLQQAPERFFGYAVRLATGSSRALVPAALRGPRLALVFGLATLLLGALAAHAIAKSGTIDRRRVSSLVIASLVALGPSLAALPDERTLMLPSLGIAAAVAALTIHAWHHARGGNARASYFRVAMGLAGIFVVVAHVGAPLVRVPRRVWQRNRYAQVQAGMIDRTDMRRFPESVLVVSAEPELPGLWMLPAWRLRTGETPSVRSWTTLALSGSHHRLTRTAMDAFELSLEAGGTLETDRDTKRYPFSTGDTVDVERYSVRVLEVLDGAPSRIEVRFHQPLDEGHVALLHFAESRFVRLQLPVVGGTIVL